jgi:TPR repeat protein
MICGYKISGRLPLRGEMFAHAKVAAALVGLAMGVLLAVSPVAQADQRPLISLSPDFDYSQLCVVSRTPPQPRNWAKWDGKSAGNVSLEAMLQDAQTLYSPLSRYARSPATAARLSLYLSQQAFSGSGRALYLYGRILADSAAASSHVDEVVQSEREAMKRGVAEAGTFLGKLYRKGDIVAVDLKAAQSYLVAAATAGDVAADLELARLYTRDPQLADGPDTAPLLLSRVIARMSANLGKGDCTVLNGFAEMMVDPELGLNDPQASVQWLQAAIRTGDLRAISALAKRYLEGGKGVEVDRQQAAELLRRAASMGHSASRLTLADLLLSNIADSRARDEAFRLLGQEEERGNPAAYQMHAANYRGAYGTPPDPVLELQNLQKAALLPDVDLRVVERLGLVYARGIGAPANLLLAKQTLVRAADMGSARAAFELYTLSSGPTPSISLDLLPLDYLREASDGGLASAMRELSSLYACGAGVDKDAAQARRWLEKAALAGDSESLMALAEAAFREKRPESDVVGFGFLQKAATGGDVEAMMLVSLAYRDGRGTDAGCCRQSSIGADRQLTADAGIAVLTEARTLLVPREAGRSAMRLKARSMLDKAASTAVPICYSSLESFTLTAILHSMWTGLEPPLCLSRPLKKGASRPCCALSISR